MALWSDKELKVSGEHPHEGVFHGLRESARVRNVHWRTMDLSAETFRIIRDEAVLAKSGKEQAQRKESVGDERLLLEVSDYDFIMAFKAPEDSPLSDPERPEGIMRHHGFLPMGIAHDAALDAEALYVLVRERERPMAAPPYVRQHVYNRMLAVLGEALNRHVHLILIGTGGRLVDQAVEFFYYQVEITDTGAIAPGAGEPLSVNDHGGDPQPVRQARFWLRNAIIRSASDLHLEPGDGAARLRYRIDGELIKVQDRIPPADMVQALTWIKAQANMDISERRRPQDGGIRLSFQEAGKERIVDVRISTIPTVHGQKMVLRLLDPETLRSLASEGLHKTILDEHLHDMFVHALNARDGIVLVTGPTGSGKTTTLNAGLFHLLRQYGDRRNMVTIEDPVEYNVPGVNQIPVNEQAGVTFARALRSILRQDPDIVLVGEIRDPETASVAVQAALTGHLILATLHTNDALGAVQRLRDLGASPFLIANTVRLLQAQRLIRTLCPFCGKDKPVSITQVQNRLLHDRLAAYREVLCTPAATVYDAANCPRCDHTGFSGRVAVMEMTPMHRGVALSIERGDPAAELVAQARRHGFRPMVENAVTLVSKGVTALSEVEAISMSLAIGDDY